MRRAIVSTFGEIGDREMNGRAAALIASSVALDRPTALKAPLIRDDAEQSRPLSSAKVSQVVAKR